MIFEARICGLVASRAVAPSASSTAAAAALHLVGAPVDLEVAELSLDDEDAGSHLGVLERHVGERFDVDPGRDLDDLRGDVAAGQAAPDPGPEIGHRLRLEAVEEDERNEARLTAIASRSG